MTPQATATDRAPAHGLRGGYHPVAQVTGGLCHALVVDDELANVAAKALRCCDVNPIVAPKAL